MQHGRAASGERGGAACCKEGEGRGTVNTVAKPLPAASGWWYPCKHITYPQALEHGRLAGGWLEVGGRLAGVLPRAHTSGFPGTSAAHSQASKGQGFEGLRRDIGPIFGTKPCTALGTIFLLGRTGVVPHNSGRPLLWSDISFCPPSSSAKYTAWHQAAGSSPLTSGCSPSRPTPGANCPEVHPHPRWVTLDDPKHATHEHCSRLACAVHSPVSTCRFHMQSFP